MNDLDEGLLTVAEACAYLAVSRGTLWSMMDRSELPYVRLSLRTRRIPKSAIKALISKALIGP